MKASSIYHSGRYAATPGPDRISPILDCYNRTPALSLFINNLRFNNCAPAIIIPMLYGLFHATAWNTHFPTEFERDLWRLSAVAVAALPSLITVVTIGINKKWGGAGEVIYTMLLLALSSLLFVTLLARVYLLVKSFLSLRSLPKDSFKSIPWEDYVVHF
jgi:hypothetical protein